jgi:hypothetical protein
MAANVVNTSRSNMKNNFTTFVPRKVGLPTPAASANDGIAGTSVLLGKKPNPSAFVFNSPGGGGTAVGHNQASEYRP